MLPFHAYLIYCSVYAIATVAPGAGMIAIVAFALGSGFRATFPAALGAAVGDWTLMTLSGCGFWPGHPGRPYRYSDLPSSGGSDTVMKTANGLSAGRHSVRYGANARYILQMSNVDSNYFAILGGRTAGSAQAPSPIK